MDAKTQDSITLFTNVASKYDSFLICWWMKKFQNAVLQEIDCEKTMSLLDVSCGTGELLLSLGKMIHPRSKLAGVDITKAMLAIARKKLPSQVVLKQQDVRHLTFKDRSFDYVVSTEAFHHYADQPQALKEMVRVAKKKVIIVDVNFFLWLLHRLFEMVEPGCVKINSREEMKQLFLDVGLKDVHQRRNFLFSVVTVGLR